MKSKRIAIIGSGISGLTCAWLLNKEFGDLAEVTLFERNDYFGGHTDTHELTVDGQTLAVDTGFIVFNHHNYPRFTNMLDELGVQSRDSDMSFSVSNRTTSFEYHFRGAASLIKNLGLFADQRFRQLFIDLLRFYKLNRDKPLDQIRTQMTLEDYVAHANLSKAFAQEHLYPMAGALWSMSAAEVKDIPLLFALGFFSNHKMLQLAGRPQWLTVQGGSNQYIKSLKARLKIHWKQEAVQSVKTQASGTGQQVVTTQGEYAFDRVIFACHGDQALSLLSDASAEEQEILSCFEYSDNTMYLHHD
ncbi:MAG: FAD-dependent oxidoreductase, partial [Pseudomonadota bacterium]|nr:FAD-dependent oxidoreductase [Pseudomonadota bacterium]